MREPIETLMAKVCCPGWPACVEEIYERVMARYDREGCFLTDPAYYEQLAQQYDILGKELDTFRRAAVAIGENEVYSRYLLLVHVFLTEVPFTRAELKEFRILPTDDGSDFALDMLPALALYSQIPRCYETLKKRGLPTDMIHYHLQTPEHTVESFRRLHNGAEGFHLFKWFQRLIRGDIYDIGCLQAELNLPFTTAACVFQSNDGQWLALAQNCHLQKDGRMTDEVTECTWSPSIEETADCWEGYPYGPDGLVSREKVCLRKAHWHIAVAPGDTGIFLHVPAGVRLDSASVAESLSQIKVFLRTYFPEYPCKAFFTSSWLLNPDLGTLLGADSNIARFGKRFLPMTQVAAGKDVFSFVFGQADNNVPLEALPENTSLQRALKQYYLDGNILYEMYGCLIDEEP